MAEWTLKEHSEGVLIVTVSGDDWKKPLAKAYKKLAATIAIPGFRKGSVPKQLLKKYLPDTHVQYEAVESIANEWLNKAVEEQGLKPVSRPTLDVKNMSNESVDLVFEFAVEPEVKLGEYKGLPYNYEVKEVTDEDVDKEIDSMRSKYAEVESIEDPAEDGDTVNIDYTGLLDGEPFEGGSAEGYDLRLGSGSFIPGFEDQLIGIREGEEKELNLTFPEEYHSADLAGKAVVFKVKVNDVKRRVLPELDDDFAKDVNAPGVESVEDLRRTVRERLEENRRMEAERKADEELFAAVAANSEIDMPKAMVDDEIENLYRQFSSQIMQYGMNPPQYLSMMGKTEEEMKETYREEAERNLRTRLTLLAIAKAEELEATEEDIEKEFQTIADMYSMEVDEIKKVLNPDMLKDDILSQKACDFVKEHAKRA
jgi:trigger factor